MRVSGGDVPLLYLVDLDKKVVVCFNARLDQAPGAGVGFNVDLRGISVSWPDTPDRKSSFPAASEFP